MNKIKFTKMVASGNDFIVAELRTKNSELRTLAKKLCNRKYGIGANGLLVLEKSKKADIKMRIFNADGSEAQMCGNGARCAALFSGKKLVTIETKAGIIGAQVKSNNVKIKLTDPKNLKLDIPLKVCARAIKVNFIDTGVPHAVIFTEGLSKIDVVCLGRIVRYHKKFLPRGTNVNFVEPIDKNKIMVRTYERGVEDETLACGTGSTACALIFALNSSVNNKVFVKTQSGEVLTVYFKRDGNNFTNVWLEGKAKIVYTGVFNV